MMKKRTVVFVVLALALATYITARSSVGEATQVSGQRLALQRVEQTVSCTGVVMAGDVRDVSSEIGCVIDEVLVEEGQAVVAGEAIATIDKEATRQLQSQRYTDALMLSTMPDELRADVDGIIISVDALNGSWLEAGMPCAVMAPRDDLVVNINIREKYLSELKQGQTVAVSGTGLRASTYSGTLEEISSAVSNTSTPLIQGTVRLTPGQIDSSFRIGLSAKVKITTQVKESGIIIPYGAVNKDEDNTYILLVEEGVVRKHAIETIAQLPEGVLVDDATLDQKVVVTQPQLVAPGETVSVRLGEAIS